MTKTILVGVGVLVVAALLAFAFWLSGTSTPDTNPSDNPPVTLPVAGSVNPGTSAPVTVNNTFTIQAVNGGVVRTKEFTKDATTVKDPINAGYYYLGYHVYQGVPDPTVTENPPYTIAYLSATQYFNISLLQEPLASTREVAEQDLLKRLGVSQGDLCRLKYTVSVPWRVNQVYASRNLGFSFCPGATQLPR